MRTASIAFSFSSITRKSSYSAHLWFGVLAGVVLLDLRFDRAAAGLAAVVPLLEVPLLGGIGDGDDLGVVLLEEGPGVGPPLAAGADDRDVHLVARGDEFWPPRTCRGTMVKAAAAAAVVWMNSRRVPVGVGILALHKTKPRVRPS